MYISPFELLQVPTNASESDIAVKTQDPELKATDAEKKTARTELTQLPERRMLHELLSFCDPDYENEPDGESLKFVRFLRGLIADEEFTATIDVRSAKYLARVVSEISFDGFTKRSQYFDAVLDTDDIWFKQGIAALVIRYTVYLTEKMDTEKIKPETRGGKPVKSDIDDAVVNFGRTVTNTESQSEKPAQPVQYDELLNFGLTLWRAVLGDDRIWNGLGCRAVYMSKPAKLAACQAYWDEFGFSQYLVEVMGKCVSAVERRGLTEAYLTVRRLDEGFKKSAAGVLSETPLKREFDAYIARYRSDLPAKVGTFCDGVFSQPKPNLKAAQAFLDAYKDRDGSVIFQILKHIEAALLALAESGPDKAIDLGSFEKLSRLFHKALEAAGKSDGDIVLEQAKKSCRQNILLISCLILVNISNHDKCVSGDFGHLKRVGAILDKLGRDVSIEYSQSKVANTVKAKMFLVFACLNDYVKNKTPEAYTFALSCLNTERDAMAAERLDLFGLDYGYTELRNIASNAVSPYIPAPTPRPPTPYPPRPQPRPQPKPQPKQKFKRQRTGSFGVFAGWFLIYLFFDFIIPAIFMYATHSYGITKNPYFIFSGNKILAPLWIPFLYMALLNFPHFFPVKKGRRGFGRAMGAAFKRYLVVWVINIAVGFVLYCIPAMSHNYSYFDTVVWVAFFQALFFSQVG